MDSIK
jgi:hypothetical protein